jgi:hypothetical protein
VDRHDNQEATQIEKKAANRHDLSKRPLKAILAQVVLLREYRQIVQIVLCAKHDDHHLGHRGVQVTLADMVQWYWRPGVGLEMRDHIELCFTCSRTKTQREIKNAHSLHCRA